jgi:hypothetical protein
LDAPTQFINDLRRNFGERLRIRWSNARSAWLIEQRVGRRREAGVNISEDSDARVRARDGYWLLLEVRTGDRMPCPDCYSTLKVPVLDTGDVRCAYCHMRGKSGLHRAAYFPLNDILIQHLRRLDPEGTHLDEVVARMDADNEAMMLAMEADAVREGSAAAADHYNRLVGIPQWGYTGKERYL